LVLSLAARQRRRTGLGATTMARSLGGAVLAVEAVDRA
jgi:hypothetical protein